MTSREPRHPIRVVARRTGISLHVLRAWERRYGVVEPGRTSGGQRLYSDADIERLRLLRDAVATGRNISQVAGLSEAELARLVAQDRAATGGVAAAEGEPAEEESGAGDYLRTCLELAERMDEPTLHRVLLRALVSLQPRVFVEGVVAPLLYEVGERWHRGRLRPSHEHAVSVAVRRVLTFLLTAYEPQRGGPALVATTVAGDPHEFGAMLASVQAAEAGWRVLYLGPSLPAEEIARAAAVSDASAVAVSAVHEQGEDALAAEIGELRRLLPAGVRLLVGGREAERHVDRLREIGGVEVGGLGLLRTKAGRASDAEAD